MSFRVAPADARRGGLIILAAGAQDGRRLAGAYAEGGYETIAAEAGDDIGVLIGRLAPPVFVLALPDAAVAAWDITGVAAASIVADGQIEARVARPPGVPAILHLDPTAHRALAAAFGAKQPDLPVHRFDASPDGERLLFLRTLRLFSANAGGGGEV